MTSGSRVTRRVLALFAACALVPVAVVILLSYNSINTALVAQRMGLLRDAAATYATGLIDRIGAAETIARTIAANPTAARARDGLGRYFGAVVAYEQGQRHLLAGTPSTLPGPRAFGGMAQRLEAGETGLAVLRAEDGAASVWLLVPDLLADRPRFVALELLPAYLWGVQDDMPYLTDLCVFALDHSQLSCTRDLPEESIATIRGQLAGEPKARFSWSAGDTRYLSSLREVFLRGRFGAEPWAIVASQPEEHALAPVRDLLVLVVPVLALGLLLAALLGLVQVRRTLGPVKALTEAIGRIAARNFDTRVDASRDDEFGAMARGLNAMSDRLGRQFKALTAQSEIDAVILSSVDLERVAAITLRRVAELTPAESQLLLLAEPAAAGGFRVHAGGGARKLHGRTVIIEAPEAARLRRAAGGLCPNGGARAGFPWLPELDSRDVIAFPITLGADLAGVLVLGYESAGLPDDDQRSLLRELCDRVAVALATSQRDQELHRRAHFDTLTNLPNRLLGIEELERAVAAASRQRRNAAVLFVDLDGFSAVNDSLGHAAGDQLLVQAAERIRAGLRKSDVVARLGGDEFAVVLPELRDAADAGIAAEHLIDKFALPFDLAQGRAFVSASVGIALYPVDAASAEQLLRHADLAMYKAKQKGRGQFAFFEASMNAEAQRRIELDRDLRVALDQDQFELHFQPQLDLKGGRIVGAEALIRWTHPQRGMVPPLQFIGYAESSGLIERIGRWALHAACRQFVAWRADGLPIEHVSVNVSPRQFRNPEFAQIVAEALQEYGMPASALRLEITESAVIDDHGAADANLEQLCRLGTPLELDDFGTGYSSLAYLQRLPVAAIKLDRAFIRPICESQSARAVVRAAIDMAHALGKSVIAEGVEHADQAALLTEIGCDTMQGYHLSAPVQAGRFAQLVRGHAAARSDERLPAAA